MKSELPKGMFRACGWTILEIIVDAFRGAGIAQPTLVIGHQGEMVEEHLGDGCRYAWQREQKGTGHAVLMAKDLFAGFDGNVIIAPGDIPLITAEALQSLVQKHIDSGAVCTVGSMVVADPTGYGRVIRTSEGVSGIVEHRDATAEQRLITEVNSGIYCFDAKSLFELLDEIRPDNDQGEYYLTDCIGLAVKRGWKVEAAVFEDSSVAAGVNDRWQLAEASEILRKRILKSHCLNGVSIPDPQTTYIDLGVEIGVDTLIHPLTTITRGSQIGSKCEIGPNTIIDKSIVGDSCSVNMSRVNESKVGTGTKIGPFAHLRPGSDIGEFCKIGNFVETKKAKFGAKAAASHLSYVGDAEVGAGANIGAGTITCNYDGFEKHRTEIGENCFIGSNSTLVAPVRIEDDAFVAAGSVVTKTVPNGSLAVGRARQENKEGWVASWRKRKQVKTDE